jgi:signal transduction histidine kinase
VNTPRRAGVRLGLQIGAVLVALLAGVSFLALLLFERAEHADADRTLRQAADELEPGEKLPDFFVVLRDPDGHLATSADIPAGMPVQPDLDRVVADGRPRQREVDAGDKDLFVRTERRGDGVVQVALDRTKAEASSGRLVTALLVAGLIGVLLAAGLAALLARRAMEPLEEALALQRRFDADAPAQVHGSEAALRRAVTALVDSALDHARGAVTVRVGLVGHRVQVRVTDDGPGVPPELGDRVFERFASSRPTPEAGRRHYGLGLALVADVAHAHRGEVRVEPGSDGGSDFVLSVPAHRR